MQQLVFILCFIKNKPVKGRLLMDILNCCRLMRVLFCILLPILFFINPEYSYAENLSVSVVDDEAIGPFQSWANVHNYGAIGDGLTDDTLPLQNALNDLGRAGKSSALYFPAGKYRITKSLDLYDKFAVSLNGEDSATTSIVWDGPLKGVMLVVNGAKFSNFSRLTWNGNHKAGTGIGQWWNHRVVKTPSSFTRHVDEVFVDMDTGIAGGRSDSPDFGQLDSETTILRTHFIRNSIAGISLGSFNALDWWIWDSEFINCARGVTNEFSAGNATGAGNFMIYRSLFRNSSVADVSIGNTQWFSLHNNTSVGSRRFLQAGNVGRNGSQFILQNNRVIDTTDPVSISVGNMGPLIILDNQIRSVKSSNGPVVSMNGSASGRDAISIGNSYTVANPIFLPEPKIDRLLSLQDKTVSRISISDALPEIPLVARNFNRRVLEVPVGASAKMIQAIINIAVSDKFENPVIHLPSGQYPLDKTLTIPARARLQLVGDGASSCFIWNGVAGHNMIELSGPSYATVRDLQFRPGSSKAANAINMDNADQIGGRILLDGTMQSKIVVSGVKNSKLDIRSVAIDGLLLIDSSAIVTGTGNIAPINMLKNSNLLVQDNWYEGQRSKLFSSDGGVFTLIGGHWAPADPVHGGGAADSSIYFNDFSGQATFVGMTLSMPRESNGIRIDNENPSSNLLFLGVGGDKDNIINRTATSGTVNAIALGKYTNNYGQSQIPDLKSKDYRKVIANLAHTRSVVWDKEIRERTPDVTDVRLLSIMTVDSGAVGLSISGGIGASLK